MEAVRRDTPTLAQLRRPLAAGPVAGLMDGYKNFQVLLAGYDSGLFDWLGRHGPTEKSVLCEALGLRGAHMGAFLQTLEDMGLVLRRGNAYRLAPDMAPFLDSASPWCQGPEVRSLTSPASGWNNVLDFLSENWRQPHAPASSVPMPLHPYLPEAQQLLDVLLRRPSWRDAGQTTPTLLCFDGGEGLLTAALCQCFPALRVTVVVPEREHILTARHLSECGVQSRCELLTGTPLAHAAQGEYDYIVMFHSLYGVRKHMTDALTATAGLLAHGGQLCCAHWFCLENCESSPGGLRDMDKAVLTDSHPLCHVEQFCGRLETLGLIDAEGLDQPGAYGNTKLHFAQRP